MDFPIIYEALVIYHPLFKDLSRSQIQKLLTTCEKLVLNNTDLLIEEGESDKQCYLLLNGTVEVIRNDQDQITHQLAQLGPGEVIGGIVFIDDKTRTATVRCTSDCEFLVIRQKDLDELMVHDKDFYHVIKNIGSLICHQFRQANEKTVQRLHEKIELYKVQVAMARFMVVTFVLLSFLSFFNIVASEYLHKIGESTYITRPLMLVLMVFLIYVFQFMRLPLARYGLTWQGSSEAFAGGVLYAIPICILTLLLKLILIRYVPSYNNLIFTPRPIILENELVYVLLIAPFQELMSRSGLQVPLEYLMPGRYRNVIAIVMSSLIFMTAHAFMSPLIASLVFIPGLYFGWLFNKYKNIIAPIVSHGIIGVWCLDIVGFS